MLRVRAFGGLALERAGQRLDGVSGQRKAMALLALLAVAGERGLARDRVVGLLWPESDEAHARGALKQLAHALRQQLGAADLLAGTDALRLTPACITSDVADFDAALRAGALDRAAAVYAGPFLDGIHLRDAAAFERWADATRGEYAGRYTGALLALARAATAAGDHAAALEWAKRLAAADPLSAPAAETLMAALAAAGDRAAALRYARTYEALVREEFGEPPDGGVTALAARLRAEPLAQAPTQPPTQPPAAPPGSGTQSGAIVGGERAPTASAPGPVAVTPAPETRTARRATGARASVVLGALAAGMTVVAAGVAVVWRRPPRDAAALAAVRSTLLPPEGEVFAGGDGLAFSPDGTQLAFTVLRAAPRPRLFVRALASGAARELAGTADAHFPFWSPDGRAVGFFAGGELRVVPVAGGPVTMVASAPNPRGGTWARDGTILFGCDPGGVIYRVRPGGDRPVAVTRRGPEGAHELPSLLPDGHRFLFSGELRTGVFVGDLRTGAQQRIRADGDAAAFAAPDHLLFEPAGIPGYGRVMAQHFDVARGAVDGEPTLIADSVFNPAANVGYAVSGTGLLVYQQQPTFLQRVWLDRRGVAVDSMPDDHAWTFRLSHGGTRVAQGGRTLWVRDLRRAIALRTAAPDTAGGIALVFPVWSPDDARIAVVVLRVPGRQWPRQIRVVRADGTGGDLVLPSAPGGGIPLDWSPDGATLLLSGARDSGTANQSLWLLDVATRAVTPWLAVAGSIPAARFSPDGRWVAYQSDETGGPEVYVRPFPGPGAPVRVSPAGGGRPAWRADGRELFYLSPAGDLMAADVVPRPPGRPSDVGAPRVLVRGTTREPYARAVVPYDASPDGQRFLLNTENRTAPPLTVLAPWPLALPREAHGAGDRQ